MRIIGNVPHVAKHFYAYRTLTGFMERVRLSILSQLKRFVLSRTRKTGALVVTPVMKSGHQRSGLGNVEGNQEMLRHDPSLFQTT